MMRHHAITASFLIIAIALYIAGAAAAATVLIVVGVIAEGIFWFRLLRRKRPDPT